MINIEKAKKEFKKHVDQIEINNPRIQTKIDHTFRVAQNCKEIANKLELGEEETKLAELIGILHDIGRFEQYKIYDKKTNSITLDTSIKFDHGKAGAEILKKDNYIRNYIEDNKYDHIIIKAIDEHNKYKLSENLSEEEKLYCKIIKDADKLDIMYETLYIYWQDDKRIAEVEEGELSQEMLQDFYDEKLANNQNRKSETDQILRFSSFIYDINFKCSLEIIKEKDYISKMIDRFNYKIPKTKEEMMKVKEIANKYINKRLESNQNN